MQSQRTGALVPDAQLESIPLAEEDILSLGELIPVTATVGSTAVGLSLHRKLCEALLGDHPEQRPNYISGTSHQRGFHGITAATTLIRSGSATALTTKRRLCAAGRVADHIPRAGHEAADGAGAVEKGDMRAEGHRRLLTPREA